MLGSSVWKERMLTNIPPPQPFLMKAETCIRKHTLTIFWKTNYHTDSLQGYSPSPQSMLSRKTKQPRLDFTLWFFKASTMRVFYQLQTIFHLTFKRNAWIQSNKHQLKRWIFRCSVAMISQDHCLIGKHLCTKILQYVEISCRAKIFNHKTFVQNGLVTDF